MKNERTTETLKLKVGGENNGRERRGKKEEKKERHYIAFQ